MVKQLDNDLVPIVSPLSADDQGTLLNINADTVAAMIACELKAEKFVLATGAPGILESLDDPRSLISYIDRAGLRRLREEGKISGGMLPKVAAIERALSGGVPRVHVISYAQADSLLLEVFTNEGTGTLVVNDDESSAARGAGELAPWRASGTKAAARRAHLAVHGRRGSFARRAPRRVRRARVDRARADAREAKLLSSADCDAICGGLEALAAAHAAGEWSIELADEDVHSALERRLTERIGEAGGRVHLGRSRNDQVLVALRLYLRDAIEALAKRDRRRRRSARARRRPNKARSPCPATRTCSPQCRARSRSGRAASPPSSPTIARRLLRVRERAELNPLGSAAGYGVPNLPLDREATRAALGFARTQEPVTAVQLSRGKAEAALVFEIAVLLGDLGRLASDLLLFYTSEFAYVSLPAEMTTGSSIMPQKRNPDVFELVRGAQATAHGRAAGNLWASPQS